MTTCFDKIRIHTSLQLNHLGALIVKPDGPWKTSVTNAFKISKDSDKLSFNVEHDKLVKVKF